MENRRPLSGVVVAELGGREAVAICGNLLAHLGATVIVTEPAGREGVRDRQRAAYMAGKHSLGIKPDDAGDIDLLNDLIGASDVVLRSSDVDGVLNALAAPGHLVSCDITAFGSTGPLSGKPWTEFQIQALCSFMDTTGRSDGPPVPIAPPMASFFAASHAATAVLAALRVRRQDGRGQNIEVAIYDAAFVSLNAYLAGILTGNVADRGRVGNRHPTTPAWNMFHARDGKVMICAGSQSQWLRLCGLMQRTDLIERYPTAQARMQALDEIDVAISAWTGSLSGEDCVNRLNAAGVAAGPVAPLRDFPREANLDFRRMVQTVIDGGSGKPVHVPASPIKVRDFDLGAPPRLSAIGADRDVVLDLIASRRGTRAQTTGSARLPLQGIRIVEVGQYTTAPMCGRALALMGADVIKIEKPGGDESRSFPPRKDERSEVYSMMNSDKRSIVLDLQSAEDVSRLRTLLADADVLLENNKPGTLDRYGLSLADIGRDFPRLVHCAISGFGADSLYADRPGFDTVIQAISGFMTAVNPGGEPLKSGVSASDLTGSLMGQLAILAGLEQREAADAGMFVDISMQDVSCWLTAPLWNGGMESFVAPLLIACADGYVVVDASRDTFDAAVLGNGLAEPELKALTRQAAADLLLALGLPAAGVNSVKEAALHPQTKARSLWWLVEEDGENWPAVMTPARLSVTPFKTAGRAPGLDENRDEILAAML